MPHSYVDNAYNRRVGRAGMPVGSMVISKNSSGGGGGGGGGGFSSGGGSGYSYGSGGHSGYSGSFIKAYVDNSYNRSHGQVGMPVSSMLIPKRGSGGGSYDSTERSKTYVDNAYNRSHDRVGKEHGTAVVYKTNRQSPEPASYSRPRPSTPNNTQNQGLDRARLPKGNGWRPAPTKCDIFEILEKLLNGEELVGNEFCRDIHDDDFFTCRTECDDQEPFDQAMYHLNRQRTKGEKSVAFVGYHDIDDNLFYDAPSRSPKLYVDNYMNRKLGRAGKIVGTAVYHKDTGEITKEYYVDNPQNQKLGRVGKPRGSLPVSRNYDTFTDMPQGRGQQLIGEEGYRGIKNDFCPGKSEYSDLGALLQINRQLERMDRRQTYGQKLLEFEDFRGVNDDFSCSCISGLGYLEPFEQVMYRLNRQYEEPSSDLRPFICPF